MHKYKLAIFDMDGTILDTINDLYNAVNYILVKFGFPKRTFDEVRLAVGNGIYNLLLRTAPKDTNEIIIHKMFDEFIPYYKAHSNILTKPYDGICETINQLRKEGVLTAMITNKADVAAQVLVHKYFEGIFDIAFGEKEGIALKPAPDSVYYVMEQLHCTKSETVYIGDSDVDLATANNAGISCISVTWGFRTKEELLSHNAYCFCDVPRDLLQLI